MDSSGPVGCSRVSSPSTAQALTAPVRSRSRGNFHFAAITAGAQHSCGLVADGTLYCWGLNASGQLGSTSTSPCVEFDYYGGTAGRSMRALAASRAECASLLERRRRRILLRARSRRPGRSGASDRPAGTSSRPRAQSRPFRPTAAAQSALVATHSVGSRTSMCRPRRSPNRPVCSPGPPSPPSPQRRVIAAES